MRAAGNKVRRSSSTSTVLPSNLQAERTCPHTRSRNSVSLRYPSAVFNLRLCAPSAVPVGVGSEGSLTLRAAEMDKLLRQGMAYLQDQGLCWPEDRDVTEEHVSTHNHTVEPVPHLMMSWPLHAHMAAALIV